VTPEELAVLVRLHHGDCVDIMRGMPAESVDAIVTDPPYGLGFMGKAWDALPPGREWADECLRVLKPGGHLLAFGGTRTWHRLAVAVEDAGFELRDSIAWLYGSGFPKSLDVSKAIDKPHQPRGPHELPGSTIRRQCPGLRAGRLALHHARAAGQVPAPQPASPAPTAATPTRSSWPPGPGRTPPAPWRCACPTVSSGSTSTST
jgi:hypothetical protein